MMARWFEGYTHTYGRDEEIEVGGASAPFSRKTDILTKITQANPTNNGLTTPTGLRKSLSADSFVKYRNGEQYRPHDLNHSGDAEETSAKTESDSNGARCAS